MAVYIIQRSSDDAVKIGTSSAVSSRMDQIRRLHRCNVSLLRTISGGRTEEAWMHAKFSDLRIGGEWFKFCEEMMSVLPPGAQDADLGGVRRNIIEITVTEAEKAKLQEAANRNALRLATWAKAHLLLAAMKGESNDRA